MAFVKASTAFCQITIPSIAGVMARLGLFLSAAEAALLNGLVQQADGLVRSAITDAQESTGATAAGAAGAAASRRTASSTTFRLPTLGP